MKNGIAQLVLMAVRSMVVQRDLVTRCSFALAILAISLSTSSAQLSVNAWATFENERTMPFQITRSGPSDFVQSVDYFTRDETALAGIHYISQTGTVTFAVSQTVATIQVPLIDNGFVDGERTLHLVLTNPVPCIDIWPSGPICEPPPIGDPPPPTMGCPPADEGPIIKDNEFPPTRLDSSFMPEVAFGPVGELPDGRILTWNRMLHPDGSIDPSFVAGQGTAGEFGPVHVLRDGKILAMFSPPRLYQWRLVRLLPEGAVDPTFNTQPIASEFKTEFPDGKLLVIYDANIADKLVRLMPEGALDPTFNSTIGGQNRITRAVVQPDGKVLVQLLFDLGNGTGKFGVMRLNADGALDTSFIRDDGEVAEFFLRSNGKILVKRRDFPPPNDWEIVQLNADGSRDSVIALPVPVWSTAVDTWIEQPEGRLLIAVGFSVRRLNSDLSLDTDFAPDFHSPCTMVGHTAPLLLTTRSGQILFAGFFDRVDGFPTRGFVRLRDVPPRPEFRVLKAELFSMDGFARIRIVRTGATTQPASVEFATVDGSAKAGTDYLSQTGRLDFASLESSKTVEIEMLARTGVHSFALQFTNPSPGYASAVIPVRVRMLPVLRIARLSSRQGSVSLSVHGTVPGETYILETSTDLKRWWSLYGLIADTGTLEFSNVQFAPASPHQFLRIFMAD